MTPGHEAVEDEQPLCSKGTDVVSWSPLKRLAMEDPRYSTFDTASLTCSDSLNSSATDDTDEDSYSVSPDYSGNRYRRISSHFSLPQNLHVIKDLSFDDFSTMEEKIHKPSPIRKWEKRRRRLVLTLPLVFTILFAHSVLNQRTENQPSDRHTQWKRFPKVDASRVHSMIQMSSIPNKFTIRLAGSRSDFLERSVDVLTRCSSVEEVQIEWKSSMRPPRKLFRHVSGKVARVEPLVTNAVLLLDEDVIFTCDELERGFQLWRLNPDRMVGFFPYHHSAPVHHSGVDSALDSPPTMDHYTTTPVSPGGGHYELISSRGAFIHNAYLESFSPSSQDDACRQFTLSVHSTAVSSKAPLAVVSNPQEQRSSDLVPLLQEWKEEQVSSCLQEWINGYDLSDLPSEESTYLGV